MDNSFERQIKALTEGMDKLSVDSLKIMKQSVKLALDPVKREMKATVPVRTGSTKKALALSQKGNLIRLWIKPGSPTGSETYTYVNKKGETVTKKRDDMPPYSYAPYEDARRPWFTKAWQKREATIEQDIADNMGPAIKKIIVAMKKKIAREAAKNKL